MRTAVRTAIRVSKGLIVTHVLLVIPMDDNLPTVHDSEGGAVDRLRKQLTALDGPMSVSNATVPLEANDVGDVPISANPRACDLADADLDFDNGYVEGYECAVEYESGRVVMSAVPSMDGTTKSDSTDSDKDGPNWALAGDTSSASSEADSMVSSEDDTTYMHADEGSFIEDITDWA